MQGWTFDDAFALMRSIGRTAAPFSTGSQLVSTSCLPYREPDGIDEEDGCTLATPTCNSLQLTLQGEFAGLRTRGRVVWRQWHAVLAPAPTPQQLAEPARLSPLGLAKLTHRAMPLQGAGQNSPWTHTARQKTESCRM
jgi:hypothetical protein